MLSLIFYYLVVPFLLFAVVLRLIRKYSPDSVPKEIRELLAQDHIERKTFRAIRLNGQFGHPPVLLAKLGDFESQQEAVDLAFEAKSKSTSGTQSSFIVINDKGEVLQEV